MQMHFKNRNKRIDFNRNTVSMLPKPIYRTDIIKSERVYLVWNDCLPAILDLLEFLAQYTTVEESGNTLYYSTQLPGSYNGGAAAVEAILALLQEEIYSGIVTIDMADAKVLADTNSVKSRIVAELEKLEITEEELEAELKAIIAETGAQCPKEMGKVMGVASKRLAGRAEGKAISAKVKELLN